MKHGAFTFVLHSHLPSVRQAGRWPHGEEWIHEAAAETYIPLLNTLCDLAEHDVPARLTLGITPVLAEQLSDPDVIRHFEQHRERFDRLAALAEAGGLDDEARRVAAELYEQDKLFPDLDYRRWAARQ